MARIGYSDEESYEGQFALWGANLNRCLLGKKGQRALQELRDALLVLPEGRLIARSLAMDGEVCAIGALLARRYGTEREVGLKLLEEISENGEDSDKYAASQGIPRMMAWAVVVENDMGLAHCTPEQRYERMLNWVEARLAGRRIDI